MITMVEDEEIKRMEVEFWKHFNIKDNETQLKNCSVNKNLKKYAGEHFSVHWYFY